MRITASTQLSPPSPSPLNANPRAGHKADRLLQAARSVLRSLEDGQAVGTAALRDALNEAFGASDSAGAWDWKDTAETSEIAQILFIQRYGAAMGVGGAASDTSALLSKVMRLAALIPTQTKRSLDSQTLQQFSTPLSLACLVAFAAQLTPRDNVLEPSAGTGMLAAFAQGARCSLMLNEIADTRSAILSQLFPEAYLSRVDGATLHDRLPAEFVPSVVLMNPPFSAALHVAGTTRGEDERHVHSSLARLADCGRLVAITSSGATFTALPAGTTLRLAVDLDGRFFAAHGTTIPTQLVVIDKGALGGETVYRGAASSPAELLTVLEAHTPPRLHCPHLETALVSTSGPGPATPRAVPHSEGRSKASAASALHACEEVIGPLAYQTIKRQHSEGTAARAEQESLYEPYQLETIHIENAVPHPTKLVQSAAMASVTLPPAHYRPHIPQRIVSEGLLSDAQLESVIYAGQAHEHSLGGTWRVNESLDVLSPAAPDDPRALRFRRGWFLGDGTGAGKGRQVAGIVLDNWTQGRRKALWVSKSDKLIEDAQRDWSALGMEKLLIVPQDRYRLGQPITLEQGILFTTYATLRSAERSGKASRLAQILEWLGADFDGAIIFDEAHAMGNAAPSKSSRGDRGPSQQGLAGLRLQHALPQARVVYVSATGATTVEHLAYAQRLGLWGCQDFPFATRGEFVSAMQKGGIAAMEVLARDLKSLGLYTARSLSYEGVEIEMLDHALSAEQRAIYDSYAHAFQIIHQNLDRALRAAQITSDAKTLNPQAQSAARSAFESNKQRFFNHLITAMKVPSLLKAIETDLAAGRAPVIQLVSTSEALLDRRLADIPASEWGDLSIDITPREYVLDYLAHGFPTQLFETYTDEEGHLHSRPALQDGHPVECREAAALRDALLERLGALPPVQSALDQIIQHFGTDRVAEVTGRTRRIVKQRRLQGDVLSLQNRPASANLSETQAFMEDRKRILVFSEAGGTGRSYHADAACTNQRLRVHYLLEAGWKADSAIQGLGRTNRTNQVQPPLFRPVTSDIKGEKRFLSTIARRLDSLGAITRGQRQTGGQGLFRPEDNLESPYARAALLQLYRIIVRGQIPTCSLAEFEAATGLSLTDDDGSLLDDLPPIPRFLNRLLALPIALQNDLFQHFETLIEALVEQAVASGTFEMGLETIRAEALRVISRRAIARHAESGADTVLLDVEREDRNHPLGLEQALALAKGDGQFVSNAQSGRAAIVLPHAALTLEDGSVQERVRLQRPLTSRALPRDELAHGHWEAIDAAGFEALWREELAIIPPTSTSRFHVVTGLLLPIWNLLPEEHPRVYRFETDDGERVIGRLIPEGALPGLSSAIDFACTPAQALERVLAGETLTLPGGWSLSLARVMHAQRLELTGFSHADIPRLKAMGLMAEIIQWRTRLFVPLGEAAQTLAVLDTLIASTAPGARAA